MSQALINPAQLIDAEEMLELVLNENANTVFPAFSTAEINKQKALDTVLYWITKEEPLAFVAKKDNRLLGFILGEIYRPWFSDEKLAAEHILYVGQRYRSSRIGIQLINIFEKTAQSYSAVATTTGQVLANYNADVRQKYLERTGYKKTTVLYTKGLK